MNLDIARRTADSLSAKVNPPAVRRDLVSLARGVAAQDATLAFHSARRAVSARSASSLIRSCTLTYPGVVVRVQVQTLRSAGTRML